MSMLAISVLGPPEVCWADVPIRLPRPRVRALLYRLAVQEEPILRRHVGFLFWPYKPEPVALRYVSQLSSQLRLALPDRAVLLVERETIGLNPSLVLSDAVRFQQMAAAYHCRPDTRQLHTLADLYRGPLLSGFSLPDCPEYEAWLGRSRTFWQRDYLAALHALLAQMVAEGEWERAAAVARRFLEVDPADEEMHRCLIDLYSRTGNRAAAEAQYATCVELLRRERGAAPQEKTVLAYRAATDENSIRREIEVPQNRQPLFAEPQLRRRNWGYEPRTQRQKTSLS